MTQAIAKPGLLGTGPVGTSTVNAASSQFHDLTTLEQKITAAIAYAASIGAKYVYVPDSFLPYNASLVTFSLTVRMIAEGDGPDILGGRAYGMDVTGGTDIAPSLQAMVNYSTQFAPGGPGGPEIVLPAGILAWNTTVLAYSVAGVQEGALRIRGRGGHATIIRPTIAPMLQIGGPLGSTTDGFSAEDFNIELTGNLYYGAGVIKLRLCREWTFKRIGLISGTNLQADLFAYAGYLFEFDSSYQGTIEKCFANGKGVYLFDFHDITDPAQQCDTFTFTNCVVSGLAFGLIHAPSGSTDDHNIVLTTCKHLLISSWNEANVSRETTITSSPIVGATSFTVASATGLVAGDFLWLGIGTTLELVKMLNVAGLTITCQPLRFAHTSGDQAYQGGLSLSTAPKCHGVWLDHFHGEFTGVVVMVAGSENVRITDFYGTAKEMIRIVDGAHATKGNIVERGQWSWAGAGVQCAIRVTATGDSANHGPVFIVGPIVDPGTGNPPAVLYQNDAGSNRTYRLIDVLSSGVPSHVSNYPTAANLVVDQMSVAGATTFEKNLLGSAYAQAVQDGAPGPTWQASVAINLAGGNFQRITATTNIAAVVQNPTNAPVNGRSQQLVLEFFNNSGGALTTPIAFGTAYRTSGTVSPANGFTISVTFRYDWSRALYLEVDRSVAL